MLTERSRRWAGDAGWRMQGPCFEHRENPRTSPAFLSDFGHDSELGFDGFDGFLAVFWIDGCDGIRRVCRSNRVCRACWWCRVDGNSRDDRFWRDDGIGGVDRDGRHDGISGDNGIRRVGGIGRNDRICRVVWTTDGRPRTQRAHPAVRVRVRVRHRHGSKAGVDGRDERSFGLREGRHIGSAINRLRAVIRILTRVGWALCCGGEINGASGRDQRQPP